jgi:hypothetical protein
VIAIVNAGQVASVRAAIDLQEHDPKRAIQVLEETRTLDLCSPLELAPAYYRGLAYLQANDPRKAVVEFQSVIDHRALADFPIYVVLSQLELGHAYKLLSDPLSSARVLSSAGAVWKDADPGFSPLKRLRTYQRKGA